MDGQITNVIVNVEEPQDATSSDLEDDGLLPCTTIKLTEKIFFTPKIKLAIHSHVQRYNACSTYSAARTTLLPPRDKILQIKHSN